MIVRRKVDTTIENKILTAFIVSSDFCREILPITNPDYFQTDMARLIVTWTSRHFSTYGKCLDRDIEEVLDLHRNTMKEADVENLEIFLSSMSDKYEDETNFNVEYYVDIAVQYYRSQAIKLLSDRLRILLEMDKVEEAENEIINHRKVTKEVSSWVDPFDRRFIRRVLTEDQDKDKLFRFPGVLGDVIGWFERGWLVGVLGPMKRGKSYWLQEFATHALFNHLKTVFVSLEMGQSRTAKRFYRRISAFGNFDGDYIYPTFDCKSNQDGSCALPKRVNQIKLLREDGKKPKFTFKMTYRPCDVCRTVSRDQTDYLPETWYIVFRRDRMRVDNLLNTTEKWERLFSANFRMLSYPAYSASVTRIKQDLAKLEYTEGFVPDVIVVDYADILYPEDTRQVGRERSDEIWKMLKNMADTNHSLVVTASQSNRDSIDSRNVTQTSVAEDIRKVAHVDVMISLNQLEIEKRRGVMRLAVIAHRDKDFYQLGQCFVLQQLELGQPNLDSEYCEDYFERIAANRNEIVVD